jgi:hypothetical protein
VRPKDNNQVHLSISRIMSDRNIIYSKIRSQIRTLGQKDKINENKNHKFVNLQLRFYKRRWQSNCNVPSEIIKKQVNKIFALFLFHCFYLHTVPTSRIGGAILPLHHTSSRPGAKKYFIFYHSLFVITMLTR